MPDLAKRWLCLVLAVISISAAGGQTGAPASPDTSTIAVPQIPDEAMQLDQQLRALPDRFPPESLLSDIQRRVSQLNEMTGRKTRETEEWIQSGALLAELQQSLLDWQSLSGQVTDLADNLTGWANSLDAEVRSLRDTESRWSRTYRKIRSEKAPPKLIELARKAIADIGAAEKLAEARRTRVAALQQSVAAQASAVSGEIGHLSKAMAQRQRSLFEQDSPRLWGAQFGEQPAESLTHALKRSYAADLARLTSFVRAKRSALFGIAFLTLAAFALFVRVARRAKTSSPDSPRSAHAHNAFRRPASLAVLAGMVAMGPLLAEAPASVVGLAYLIAMVPVVRLLMPRLTPRMRMLLVALIVSVITAQLIRSLLVPVWIKRDLLAVFCFAVAVTFWRLARLLRRDRVQLERAPAATLAVVRVGLALIVTALLANVFGYFALSDLLTYGTLATAYRAVALYTVFVVGSSMIRYALEAETSQRLAIIRAGTDRLARRLSFALGLGVFLFWLHTALNLFTVRGAVNGAIAAALDYRITIGSAAFPVRNIVAFVLTLVFGYVIASLTRAVLNEVLPRLTLARGLPNAIATITHYVVLLLVFILALAAGGVELSRFTILTGAIGVGLGFGLQNVVNNFASGLILLFERPIRLGDFLEVEGISGEVAKIGFRSSTLSCFDGSALIIPNANLISQQVINWTLIGTRRQILLNVQVAHGNDPARVRDLLSETVLARPEVLQYPKPSALFLGFGDSALNFEVRFWAPRPEAVPELKSEVALSIVAALGNDGIKAAIPQRELYIKSTDQTGIELARSARDGGQRREDRTRRTGV